MAKQWDGTEFFKMMADNEKNVAVFYRKLAEDAAIGGKFFEKLAKDEDRHYKIYTKLLEKHSANKGLEVAITEKQGQYLDLLIENNGLKDIDKVLKKVARLKDKDAVFAIAEQAERDAVLYVEELLTLYPDSALADFGIVLKEEKEHLRQVMARRMESKLNVLRL